MKKLLWMGLLSMFTCTFMSCDNEDGTTNDGNENDTELNEPVDAAPENDISALVDVEHNWILGYEGTLRLKAKNENLGNIVITDVTMKCSDYDCNDCFAAIVSDNGKAVTLSTPSPSFIAKNSKLGFMLEMTVIYGEHIKGTVKTILELVVPVSGPTMEFRAGLLESQCYLEEAFGESGIIWDVNDDKLVFTEEPQIYVSKDDIHLMTPEEAGITFSLSPFSVGPDRWWPSFNATFSKKPDTQEYYTFIIRAKRTSDNTYAVIRIWPIFE